MPHRDWFRYFCYTHKKKCLILSVKLCNFKNKFVSSCFSRFLFSISPRFYANGTSYVTFILYIYDTQMWEVFFFVFEKEFTNVLNAVLTFVILRERNIFRKLKYNLHFLNIISVKRYKCITQIESGSMILLCVPDGIIWITGITNKKYII